MTLRPAGLVVAATLAAGLAIAQTGGLVQGRVISSAHGEPVANALVTLRELQTSGSAPQVYICQTGADGRFSIAGLAPGVYDPSLSKQGFETRPLDRPASAHDFPPVTVEAGKPVTLDLRMTPDAVIAGKVMDADGDPVPYAQVEAQQYAYMAGKKQLRNVRAAQTNDRGEYRMFNLAPGRYFVRAQSTRRSNWPMNRSNEQVRGILPPTATAAAYYPGVADAARATELQALPGGELDAIDFHLAPEKIYSIRGKLPAGDPAKVRRQIRVVSRSNTQERASLMGMSVGRDSYEIAGIAPGAYLVIGDWFNPANQEEHQYAREAVDIIDRDVDNVDLTFMPGVKLKGTMKVEGETPLPLENLVVLLQSADNSGQQQAKIGADGKFTSPELAPEIYHVRIAGRNAYVKSIRVGDQEAPDGKIDMEHPAGAVTIVISGDLGRVEGTVTDEAGKPVYNADVTLLPTRSGADMLDNFRSAFSSIGGKFNFPSVPPGEYKAFAWMNVEPGAPQSADFRKPYEDRGVVIKVEPNGRQTLDLKTIVAAPER